MKREKKIQRVIHEFSPLFDENSKVLMLGTMPSPASRENGFYYGHPRNRFWPVLADVCRCPCPITKEEKISFALEQGIAVWDVLAGCDICGADDGSIQNPVPNDLNIILKKADIKAVFATGTKAFALYKRYCLKETGVEAVCLPSTSPANCRVSFEELVKAYSEILNYL